MKTTLDIDDHLLTEAKRRAAEQGLTLRALVEESLRARLLPRFEERAPYRAELPVVTGTRPPAVDVADRRALYDVLDERP